MYLWHSPVCNNTTPHNRNEFVHVMKTSRMCACALHYTYIYISSRRDGEQEWVFEGSAYSMLPCEWLNRVCTVFTPRFVRYEARDSILPSMMNRPTLYTETRQRYQRFGIYCLRSYMYYSHYIYNMLTNQHRLEKKIPEITKIIVNIFITNILIWI